MSGIAHPEHLRSQRRRRFCRGPLPKDLRLQYPYTLWAVEGDADKLVVTTGTDRASNYGAGAMVLYTLAGMAFLAVLMVAVKGGTFRETAPFLLLAVTFLCGGWYCGRKARSCDGGPYMTFDRANGLVHIDPVLWRAARTYRFRDLEAYFVRGGPNQFGLTRGYVHVYPYDERTNRAGRGFVLLCGPVRCYEDAVALWATLCQYMDRRRPLPNLPPLWEALLAQRGWVDEADRQHQFDRIVHEYAVRMRRLGIREDLGVDPHLDPLSNLYRGPRSRAEYAAELAARSEAE